MSAGQLSVIGVDIRNFKRIELLSMQFDKERGLITVGGENAAGKSSVLDAMYSALVRVPGTLTNPVRDGADEAHIRVLIGSGQEVAYRVIRRFSRTAGPSILVTNAKGEKVTNGGQVLKELLSAAAVDPVAFLNLEPKEQRDTLARLVGLDLTQYDTAIETARERLKELESNQARCLARVEELPWYDDAPESELSAGDLVTELQKANEHNQAGTQLRTAVTLADSAVVTAQARLQQNQEEQARIEQQIAQLKARQEALQSEAQFQASAVEAKVQEAEQAKAALAAFEPVDTTPITDRMASIDEQNAKWRANAARLRAAEEWTTAESEVKEQVEAVKAAEAAKRKALADAKFPVDGLAFDAKQIVFLGQPFSQASMAQRIRVACAICMQLRGKAAPIFIRDASTLDNASLAMVDDMAKQYGAQVFAEIVANRSGADFDRDCDFYIVDGALANSNLGDDMEEAS